MLCDVEYTPWLRTSLFDVLPRWNSERYVLKGSLKLSAYRYFVDNIFIKLVFFSSRLSNNHPARDGQNSYEDKHCKTNQRQNINNFYLLTRISYAKSYSSITSCNQSQNHQTILFPIRFLYPTKSRNKLFTISRVYRITFECRKYLYTKYSSLNCPW